MSVERLLANFLRIANEDLEGARLLAASGNRNAIYLCEQAAEKIIRAVVTSEGKHAGVKHDLAEIVDLIPDENPMKPGCGRSSTCRSTRPPTGIRFRRAPTSGSLVRRATPMCEPRSMPRPRP
jgi:hypothetical protein